MLSAPAVLADILPSFVPYTLVLAAFGGFVVWNGGIVLGKSAVNGFPSGN
jgi:alpha-1,2-glucosyltransferase